MIENLDVGTIIQVTANASNNGTIEKYCYDDIAANCTAYGGLYQWNEAMAYSTTADTKGICPTGWHIPTKAEFQILVAGVSNDGNALKAVGQGTGSGAGTNTSGFSALLAGVRNYDAYFSSLGVYSDFWSSTGYDASTAYTMYMYYNDMNIYSYNNPKGTGISVRCIKD